MVHQLSKARDEAFDFIHILACNSKKWRLKRLDRLPPSGRNEVLVSRTPAISHIISTDHYQKGVCHTTPWNLYGLGYLDLGWCSLIPTSIKVYNPPEGYIPKSATIHCLSYWVTFLREISLRHTDSDTVAMRVEKIWWVVFHRVSCVLMR